MGVGVPALHGTPAPISEAGRGKAWEGMWVEGLLPGGGRDHPAPLRVQAQGTMSQPPGGKPGPALEAAPAWPPGLPVIPEGGLIYTPREREFQLTLERTLSRGPV